MSDQELKLQKPNKKFAYINKQRVLIIASRGITARYRHFLEDLKKLIPHHKKDNKLDSKGQNILIFHETYKIHLTLLQNTIIR